MTYVTVPKELTKVKSKVVLNLTKRQLVCFGTAVVVGGPLFFLIKNSISQTVVTFIMVFVIRPFFMLTMYEKHGQSLKTIFSSRQRKDSTRQKTIMPSWKSNGN